MTSPAWLAPPIVARTVSEEVTSKLKIAQSLVCVELSISKEKSNTAHMSLGTINEKDVSSNLSSGSYKLVPDVVLNGITKVLVPAAAVMLEVNPALNP